jgi:hypothetical protein
MILILLFIAVMVWGCAMWLKQIAKTLDEIKDKM